MIRVMVEAESDELCKQYVYQMVDLIKKEKGYGIIFLFFFLYCIDRKTENV